jgi:plasmid maintenance system antidote protein VapI
MESITEKNPNTDADLIGLLMMVFEDRKKQNKRYSLREFAFALDLNSGTLSAILSRKRPLTVKQAIRIMNRLDIQESTLPAVQEPGEEASVDPGATIRITLRR